jgi:CheY-like chemotaxis protein
MKVSVTDSFVFQTQELPQKLSQTSEGSLTGYWLCEFFPVGHNRYGEQFYIGLLQGQVVFSGQQISWEALIKALQRYVPRLRSEAAKHAISIVRQRLQPKQQNPQSGELLALFAQLYQANVISHQEVIEALRLKILSDFDTCLFKYAGKAQFIPFPQLDNEVPIAGFDLQKLLSEAEQRQVWWSRLQPQISSMNCVPVLNQRAVEAANLTPKQKQRLEVLTANGKTLDEIAFAFAQDSLEIAEVFARLVKDGLITLTSSFAAREFSGATHQDPVPQNFSSKILVVDDSPLLLKQFANLVRRWGYQVKTSTNPETVVELMLQIHPAIVFLDVNMPGVSGFDLVKQIRRCPEFEKIPLIILTAEKTLTNNWRARWSGCRFLTKPLAPDEVSQFQVELHMLLEELLSLPAAHQVKYPSRQDDSQYQLRNSSV